MIYTFRFNELKLISLKKCEMIGQPIQFFEEICLTKNHLPHWL